MTTALSGAVELLERSLAYTRGALACVTDADLERRTPCADWVVADLLAHMEDALDAFTEAAGGSVTTTAVPSASRVERIRDKACRLLGVWTSTPAASVHVADQQVDSDLLLQAAALEITVHGWDVARSLALERPIPEALAERLLDAATALVTDEDRVVRFAYPRPITPVEPTGARLLAFLGRTP